MTDEERHRQGRRHPRDPDCQAGKAGAEGPRRALDAQARSPQEGTDGKLMAEIATPMFGYKSHIGIDQRHGFIRTWSASDAARYDGREMTGLIDPANTGSSIWADTAYRSQKNERAILRAGRVLEIHSAGRQASRCRPSVSAPMPRVPKSAPPSSMCSPCRAPVQTSSRSSRLRKNARIWPISLLGRCLGSCCRRFWAVLCGRFRGLRRFEAESGHSQAAAISLGSRMRL